MINLGQYTTNISYQNTDIRFFESEVIGRGHEIGSHGIRHINTIDFDLEEASDWAEKSLTLVEDNTIHTSRWGETCLSLAYPYSRTNIEVMKALYNAGFRVAGNSNNVPGLVINATNSPQSELDWMNICRLGGKVTPGETDVTKLYLAEQTGALADCMYHQNDDIDQDFLQYLKFSKTVWYATWGEVRSYYYLLNHTTVQYNKNASSETQKVFDMVYPGQDLRIWNVPITLMFDVNDYTFNDISIIDQASNIQDFELKNITVSQHMEEGYKYDKNTSILYVSMIPGEKQIILNAAPLSENSRKDIFSGYSRWWNGLTWAVTIHVDDVTNVYKVLNNYGNCHIPLTLMIMGKAMDQVILYSVYIVSIIILVPIIFINLYNHKKTRNLDIPSP